MKTFVYKQLIYFTSFILRQGYLLVSSVRDALLKPQKWYWRQSSRFWSNTNHFCVTMWRISGCYAPREYDYWVLILFSPFEPFFSSANSNSLSASYLFLLSFTSLISNVFSHSRRLWEHGRAFSSLRDRFFPQALVKSKRQIKGE